MHMYDHIICNNVLSKGCGLLKDLESNLSVSCIRDLELLGYIEKDFSPQSETWRLTEKGKKLQRLMIGRKGIDDIIKDWIYIHLLKFNIKI